MFELSELLIIVVILLGILSITGFITGMIKRHIGESEYRKNLFVAGLTAFLALVVIAVIVNLPYIMKLDLFNDESDTDYSWIIPVIVVPIVVTINSTSNRK